MTAPTLVWKVLHNATRCFDIHLWAWQARAVKKLIKGICTHETTVLQKLYTKESWITANKYRESLSNHLESMDLEPILHEKTKRLVAKTNKYKSYNILAGDASDIFKPHAQAMQWIGRVRDGSTWLVWNGYVVYGININGITHQVDIKDPSVEYIGSEKREIMLKKSKELIQPQETIWVFDRWHDDIAFIDMLQELQYHYIVRWRKNRIITLNWTSEEVKVGTLPCWRYEAILEIGTCVYVYVVKWAGKNPIILYSDLEFEIDEECLEIYKRRRKIELDYSKMKSFWLEKVRLMSMRKVVNIMRIIQFIIMLWQDLYNEVTEWLKILPMKLVLMYKEYCRKTKKGLNPSSMLTFVSEYISWFKIYKLSEIPKFTLFGSRRNMKKVGLI